MEQQVEERTREFKVVNEQLKQFAYSASHDLQEPLRKITLFLERLLSNLGPLLTEDNRKIAQRILHTTNRMRNLIDDLLNYSNTTLGVTGFEEVALGEIVQNVLQDMEAIIIENHAQVNVKELPKVKGDALQLRQLFQNLVSNALKYHKKGDTPQVKITAQVFKGNAIKANIPAEFKRNNFHLIQVKDNGIGFNPDYAEHIFGLFHRLHGRAEYQGTGVGLAIVQKVVENHQGFIWADSQPGAGATFNVLLPAG